MVGRVMLRSAWRPGTELIVVELNDVHGRICRMSHQKCLVLLSRTCMLIWRTSAGAGLDDVRYAIMVVLFPSSGRLGTTSSKQIAC